MDGLFSSNKRQFGGPQGSKENPDGLESPRAAREAIDPVKRASADIMKTRKIVAPRSRKPGASRDNSIDRQLGNPFANIPSSVTAVGANGFTPTPFGSAAQSFPPSNNNDNNNSNGALFSQQKPQAFTFGAAGSQSSSSFPPASNPFGSSTTQAQPQPKTSGFTFGASTPAAATKNPFSFGASTPQPTPPAPAFSFSNTTQKPTSKGSLFSFDKDSAASDKVPTAAAESSNPFGAATTSGSTLFSAKTNTPSTPAFGQSTSAQSSNLFANQKTTADTPGGMFAVKPTTNTSVFGPPPTSTPAQNSFNFGTSPAASPSTASAFAQSTSANSDDMMTSPPVTPPKKPASPSTTSGSKPTPSDNPFSSLKMMPSTPTAQPQLFGSIGQTTQKTSTPQAPPTTPNPFITHPEPATVAKPTAAPAMPLFSTTPTPAKETAVPTNTAPSHSSPISTPAGSGETEAQRQYRRLNQSFKARLSSMNEDYDWSPMFQAYLLQVERMKDAYTLNPSTKRAIGLDAEDSQSKKARAAEPEQEVPIQAPSTPPAEQPAASLFSPQPSTTPTSSPNKSQTANLFASIVGNTPQQDTPKPSASPFSPQPPAPAHALSTPAQGPNPFAAQAASSSSTSNIFGASQVASPQKPATFGATPRDVPAEHVQPPNPFAHMKQMPPQPSPSKSGLGSPAQAARASSPPKAVAEAVQPPNPFASMKQMPPQPSPSKSTFGSPARAASPPKAAAAAVQPPNPFANMKQMPPQSSSGKSIPETAAPSAPSMPKFELPKFGTSTGGDAFAAFGAQAEKSKLEAEKAAEKKELEARFDDEFDSENETESAFNKRVLAEIRAKRAKAKEAKAAAPAQAVFVPGKGFSFASSSSTSDKATESQETPPSSAETTPATAKPALFTPAPTTAINGRSIFDTAAKPVASSTNLFSNLAKSTTAQDDAEEDGSDAEDDADRPSQADPSGSSGLGRSLFDRITKPGVEENSTNGHVPAPLSTPSTAEDHTWKNDSPIKFGGSTSSSLSATPSKTNGLGDAATPAPKPFTNIFGSAKANATPSLFSQSPAKPAVGFGFGTSSNGTSAAASQSPSSTREGSVATTTDEVTATTNSEANNLDGAQPEPQVSLTDLSAEERLANEILLEVPAARIQTFDSKAKTWQKRGLGPLRVLKNKESGKTLILARSDPHGKVTVNTLLFKGMPYDHPAKGRVKIPTLDRNGKMTTTLVTVKDDAVATELVEVLLSNRPE